MFICLIQLCLDRLPGRVGTREHLESLMLQCVFSHTHKQKACPDLGVEIYNPTTNLYTLTWSLQKQDPITIQRTQFIFHTTQFIVLSGGWV